MGQYRKTTYRDPSFDLGSTCALDVRGEMRVGILTCGSTDVHRTVFELG